MRRLLFSCFALMAMAAFTLRAVAAPPLTVFAAASLKNSLDAVDAAYMRETGATVRASYAASSALARQIEQGAPADVFISADEDWMDYAGQHGLIQAGTRRDLLTNHLALIAPTGSPVTLAHRTRLPAGAGARERAAGHGRS